MRLSQARVHGGSSYDTLKVAKRLVTQLVTRMSGVTRFPLERAWDDQLGKKERRRGRARGRGRGRERRRGRGRGRGRGREHRKWIALKRATDIQSLPQKRCAGKQKGMGVVVKRVVQGPVKQLLLQILVVVAIIQMGILKCEVD